MIKTLLHLLSLGRATPRDLFPALPDHSRGLPALTGSPCTGCSVCVDICPTQAITVGNTTANTAASSPGPPEVRLDRGLCIACGLCIEECPTGTIVASRETKVAAASREALVLTSRREGLRGSSDSQIEPPAITLFRRSIHLRVVATGDSATDLEVAAANNPIFDASRFGVHFVASPRFADGLLVTGPVPRAMKEPLRRCYEAMAEPRLVIAVGASAISGGVHRGGYAGANGVDAILPVNVYVPGSPPHPWSILHGILLAMEAPLPRARAQNER